MKEIEHPTLEEMVRQADNWLQLGLDYYHKHLEKFLKDGVILNELTIGEVYDLVNTHKHYEEE